jgi:hypothetical protein
LLTRWKHHLGQGATGCQPNWSWQICQVRAFKTM